MSYDTDKVTAGRQRIDVVQVVLGACSLTFGTSPCSATGEKCFKSWETCKDAAAYTATTKTITFCTPQSAVIPGYIPFLKSVSFDPGDITPEDGIGKVGSVTVKFIDAPHDDVGIDPHITDRTYDPLTRGTFWPRLRSRWPHYQGRTLYWYTGYYSEPFSLSNLKKRTYVIERLEGFGREAGVTIVAKDPLKLADDNRAVWPRKSSGTLAETISDVATPTTLDIATNDDTEYDLDVYETTSAVRIGGELFTYTGTTPITGGVQLTGVTRGAPSPYECEQAAHDIGDDVQKCAFFSAMKAPDIIRRLLILGAGVDAAYIDYTAWEALYDTWKGGLTLTRLVCEPEGVNTLITEVLQQSSGWGLWWDDVNEAIEYEITRPAALGETVTEITDDANIVAGSIVISDDPDRLINDAILYYEQRDPTKKEDEVSNYSEAVESLDLASISTDEVGSRRVRIIYGRWLTSVGTAYAVDVVDKLVQSRGSVPYKVEFKLDRKDDALQTGDFVDITTNALRDIYGQKVTTRCRVTRVDNSGDEVRYLARQDFSSTRYALIAPNTLDGETWATADGATKNTYMFIADAGGIYSDGTEGKRIY